MIAPLQSRLRAQKADVLVTNLTKEKWINEQKDIDELKEFQNNVDVLRITYKGYIEERNLTEISLGKSIVSMIVRSKKS